MISLEEKLTTKWYREHSHKLHMQRLQDIKTHGSKRIDNAAPKTKGSVPPQKQGKAFLKKELTNAIKEDNRKLLKILTEISAGKRETTTRKILRSSKETPIAKSLNISVRKKEARRIDEDNEALIRRLNDKAAELSFKKFEENWAVVSKYRESISKKGNRFGSSQLSARLPPMEENKEKSENEANQIELIRTLNFEPLKGKKGKLAQISKKKSLENRPVTNDTLPAQLKIMEKEVMLNFSSKKKSSKKGRDRKGKANHGGNEENDEEAGFTERKDVENEADEIGDVKSDEKNAESEREAVEKYEDQEGLGNTDEENGEEQDDKDDHLKGPIEPESREDDQNAYEEDKEENVDEDDKTKYCKGPIGPELEENKENEDENYSGENYNDLSDKDMYSKGPIGPSEQIVETENEVVKEENEDRVDEHHKSHDEIKENTLNREETGKNLEISEKPEDEAQEKSIPELPVELENPKETISPKPEPEENTPNPEIEENPSLTPPEPLKTNHEPENHLHTDLNSSSFTKLNPPILEELKENPSPPELHVEPIAKPAEPIPESETDPNSDIFGPLAKSSKPSEEITTIIV